MASIKNEHIVWAYGDREDGTGQVVIEPARPKSQWLDTNECVDAFALKLNGLARNCVCCRRLTSTRYLTDGSCPDCRSEDEVANQ